MRSKMTLIHGTVLKKDILRYAPIWGCYTIFMLLFLFSFSDLNSTAWRANNFLDFASNMAWLNCVYAGICAAFLFMDLFNSRLCNALHAFPLRRESWLMTHITAGFLFSFVPNLLFSLLGCIILWEYAYIAFIWLAVFTLQFLFFFGTAVLSAMCAGNLLGMAAIYGIIHSISLLVFGVLELLYQPLLYGVQLHFPSFHLFFPLGQLSSHDYVLFAVTNNSKSPGEFKGFLGESWLYLGICAAVGVVSLILAWRVYRRQKLESAGNFISLQPLAPLFLGFCTIGAGAFLYLFSESFDSGHYLFLAIGLAIGYFAGRMLLSRTLRVFSKRSLMGLGIFAAVLAGSLWLTWLDPAGITTYIPDIDNVVSASVVGADRDHYYVDSSSFSYSLSYSYKDNNTGFRITDREELVLLQDFHRQLTRNRPDDKNGTLCTVQIHYTLKDGNTVSRFYKVNRDSSLGERAGRYFSDMRYLFQVNDPSVLYRIFEGVVIEGFANDKSFSVKLTEQAQIAGLLDALKADCEANVMAQNWAYHDKYEENYYIEFLLDAWAAKKEHLDFVQTYLRIWTNCTNTTAYLRDMVALHAELG